MNAETQSKIKTIIEKYGDLLSRTQEQMRIDELLRKNKDATQDIIDKYYLRCCAAA